MLGMESWSMFAKVAKRFPSRVVKIIIGLEIAHNNSVEHRTDSEQRISPFIHTELCQQNPAQTTTHITEFSTRQEKTVCACICLYVCMSICRWICTCADLIAGQTAGPILTKFGT